MTDRKLLMYRRQPDLLRRDILCELGIGRMHCADLTRRLFDADNSNDEFPQMYAIVSQCLRRMHSVGDVTREKTRQHVMWGVP